MPRGRQSKNGRHEVTAFDFKIGSGTVAAAGLLVPGETHTVDVEYIAKKGQIIIRKKKPVEPAEPK